MITEIFLDTEYSAFLSTIKKRYRNAQLKAAHAVNSEMIAFYWELGKDIIEKQTRAIWGSKFLERLSMDLQIEFPGTTGFSIRNLKYMRKFAQLHPNLLIGQQAVAQLPWGHIILLMEKINNPEIREWYALNTIKY